MNLTQIDLINKNTLDKIQDKTAVPLNDKYFGFYEAKLNSHTTRTLFSASDDPRCNDLLYLEHFEPTSMELAYHLASYADYFIDVGAHTGMYSLGVSESNSKIKILAFEPNPIAFSRLVMHVSINELDKTIIPINYAVGSNNKGIAKLSWKSNKSFGWLSSGTRTDTSSDGPLRLDQSISPVFTLDQINTKVNLKYVLKIDVEGFELEVFHGALNFLKSKPDIILESFSDSNVRLIESIIDKDYRFFKIIENEKRIIETTKLLCADINSGNFNSLLTCNTHELMKILTSVGFIVETLD